MYLAEPLVDRKQFFAVEGLAVQIGKTAEAAQPQFIDRPLDLIERSLDIAGRQGEKSDEAFRMFACNRSDRVVGDARDLHCALAFEAIGARRGYRQHVDIDAQLVHMLKATLDVLPLQGRCIDPALELLIVKIPHAAVRIRLFKNHRAVQALHLGEIRFGKHVCLKIDNHLICFVHRSNRSFPTRNFEP